MKQYRANYIDTLRRELLEMVEEHFTPAALRYSYSETPLEATIKWQPLVLVLGNYSSGKSAMINEFIGADIQSTGQAPTDDSFTIITCDKSQNPGFPIQVTEERDGKFLLNDPEFPFENLKKYGQRFSAHFRFKKVNSEFLNTMSIIDTPGMLDSISERDRGYNYQEVIGDLAQIADLILVLFDPHKAGTVREAHTSLRETLPAKTFEDRIIFVLNRIDECSSFKDLLRVYGTLCWNLSQITGRKDIPKILLTYSQTAALNSKNRPDFLDHLENQRDELKKEVLKAPERRLDNLAAFVENHGERLSHFLEALFNFRSLFRKFHIKLNILGIIFAILSAGAIWPFLFRELPIELLATYCSGVAFIITILWMILVPKLLNGRFTRKKLKKIDELTLLNNQTRRDSWEAIRDNVKSYIEKTRGKFSLWEVKKDFTNVRSVFQTGSQEIREALNELSGLKDDPDDTIYL